MICKNKLCKSVFFFTIDENNIFFNAMNLNMLYKMDFVKEVYLEEVKK